MKIKVMIAVTANGLPGAGKTTALTRIVDAALARGDRVLLRDLKGDFVGRYYSTGRAVLLGPWDARAAVWDAAADIDFAAAPADEVGAATHSVSGNAGPRFSLCKWLTGEAHAGTQIAIFNASARHQRASAAIFGAMLSVVAASQVPAEVGTNAEVAFIFCGC